MAAPQPLRGAGGEGWGGGGGGALNLLKSHGAVQPASSLPLRELQVSVFG